MMEINEFLKMWYNVKGTVRKIKLNNDDVIFATDYVLLYNNVILKGHEWMIGRFKLSNIDIIECE